MSSNGHQTWENHDGGAQRGPSFEDPTQPSTQPQQSYSPPPSEPPPQTYPYATDPGAAPAVGQPVDPWGEQYQAGQDPWDTQAYADNQNPYAQANPYAQGGLYRPPYGSYAPYGTYAYAPTGKSKSVAALLAFFLGGFGAHNFFLNQKNLGLAHLGLGIGSFVMFIVTGALANSVPASSDGLVGVLAMLAFLMWVGNGIWALVEFVMILIKPEHELGL